MIGADRTAGHHQPDFDADEAALEIGFEMFKGLIPEDQWLLTAVNHSGIN